MMKSNQSHLMSLLLVVSCNFLFAKSSFSEPTLELRITGPAEVFDGDPETSSIDADGVIAPGRDDTVLASFEGVPVVSIEPDRKDSFLVATSGSGLYRVSKLKKTMLLESKSLAVTAVHRHAGELYAATSPDGEILIVGKKPKALVKLEAKYVWDLETYDGELLAATGSPGQIVKLGKPGSKEVVFEADETHLRAMLVHPKRGLIFGGGEKGIIYAMGRNGKVHALYDSPLKEVTDLAVDPKTGDLFAALISETKSGKFVPEKSVPSLKGDEQKPKKSPIKRSRVIRIAANGRVDILWNSSQEGALSLAFDEKKNQLLFATGTGSKGRGRVYAVDFNRRDRIELLARTDESLVSSVVLDGDRLVLGTAPSGRVLSMSTAPRKESFYLSKTEDLNRISKIGRIWFDADQPKGTKVALEIRTGNTEEPDKTWSNWSSKVSSGQEGGAVDVPDGRYAQFRVQLTSNGKASPRVKSMHASLIRMNVAPFVEEVYTLRRGVYLYALPPEGKKEKTVTVSASSLDKLRGWGGTRPRPPRARQGSKPGMLTVAWRASDRNRDTLLYRLEMASESAKKAPWQLLADDLETKFYSMDSRAFPDGVYRFRVTATDRPSNPPEFALSDREMSIPVTIDNLAPEIGKIEAKVSRKGKLTFEVLAQDKVSILEFADFSLNGGPWLTLPAKDGLLDAKSELLAASVTDDKLPGAPKLRMGINTIAVRVGDLAGNHASRTVSFKR
ncbi:MAG: hypothetical protein VYC39_05655 [Myxococcota bacterium]|nr:hypothetical protein [Myxococcota bacterium]